MCADQLAILGEPMNPKDIIDKVLENLDASNQGVINGVHAHARNTSNNKHQLPLKTGSNIRLHNRV